jgi:hypothetical protein
MADLRINADEWNSVTPPQRDRIKQILVDCKLLDTTDQIISDPNAPKMDQLVPTLSTSICKAACTAAQSIAVAACQMLPTPIEVAACTAAALAADEFCRSKCSP